jgi:hypothetical protein
LISFKNKLTNDEAEEAVVVVVDDESVLDSIQSKISRLNMTVLLSSIYLRLKSINGCVFGRKIIVGLDSVLCDIIVNKSFIPSSNQRRELENDDSLIK